MIFKILDFNHYLKAKNEIRKNRKKRKRKEEERNGRKTKNKKGTNRKDETITRRQAHAVVSCKRVCVSNRYKL
jgi:hypothetical protein